MSRDGTYGRAQPRHRHRCTAPDGGFHRFTPPLPENAASTGVRRVRHERARARLTGGFAGPPAPAAPARRMTRRDQLHPRGATLSGSRRTRPFAGRERRSTWWASAWRHGRRPSCLGSHGPSEVRTRRECRDWVCASQPRRCLAPSSGRFWSHSPAIRTRTFRGHRSEPVNASRPPATAAVSSIGPKNNGVDRRGRLVAGWSLTNGSATHLVSVAVSCGSMAARCMRQCWRSGSGKPPARR